MVPACKTEAGTMSHALTFARARGWNPGTTLMVCMTVFHAGDDESGVMPLPSGTAGPASPHVGSGQIFRNSLGQDGFRLETLLRKA
jgi:hypothetical protein